MDAQEAMNILFEVDHKIMQEAKSMPDLGSCSFCFKNFADCSRQELYEFIFYYNKLHQKEMQKNTELKINHVHELADIAKKHNKSFLGRILDW